VASDLTGLDLILTPSGRIRAEGGADESESAGTATHRIREAFTEGPAPGLLALAALPADERRPWPR
jgi:hypothetical protein